MNIPLFPIVSTNAAVQAALGTSPVRFYPFDFATQPGTPAYAVPYAVWQVVTGLPENYLDCPPDVDSYSIQIDVYGGSVTEVQAAVKALRDALEPHGYITRWGNEEREEETGLYRYGFDFDYWVKRE